MTNRTWNQPSRAASTRAKVGSDDRLHQDLMNLVVSRPVGGVKMRGSGHIVENAGEWLKIVVVIGTSRSFLSSLTLPEIALVCVLLCYPRVTAGRCWSDGAACFRRTTITLRARVRVPQGPLHTRRSRLHALPSNPCRTASGGFVIWPHAPARRHLGPARRDDERNDWFDRRIDAEQEALFTPSRHVRAHAGEDDDG